jgi:mRNA interferase MazF
MKAGDVVVLHFPFSDLSGSKLRPAVVLADVGRNDVVACQVTSNREADPAAVELTATSFTAGGLNAVSFARPGKLFTAHGSIIAKRVGRLTDAVTMMVKEAVIRMIEHS